MGFFFEILIVAYSGREIFFLGLHVALFLQQVRFWVRSRDAEATSPVEIDKLMHLHRIMRLWSDVERGTKPIARVTHQLGGENGDIL